MHACVYGLLVTLLNREVRAGSQVKFAQRYCNHLDINSISRHMEFHTKPDHSDGSAEPLDSMRELDPRGDAALEGGEDAIEEL